MANGVVFTNNGRKVVMHRGFEAVPTLTAPTKFGIGTGTTTPTNADTALATQVKTTDGTAGTTTKAIVTGYPTFDDTNLVATTRSLLLTTEGQVGAGTTNITEYGLFNTDGTPLLCSHAVFTAIAKTNSIQAIFIEKDRVTS